MSTARILVVGHSHIMALWRAWEESDNRESEVELDFLWIRDKRYAIVRGENEGLLSPTAPDSINRDLLVADYCTQAKGADWVVVCMNGNEHQNIGLLDMPTRTFADVMTRVSGCENVYTAWLRLLIPYTHVPMFLLPPPPPIEAEEYILRTRQLERMTRTTSIRNASDRLKFWEKQIEIIRSVAERFGLGLLNLPEGVFSRAGFMAEDCRGTDHTHGNTVYGRRVLAHVVQHLQEAKQAQPPDRGVSVKKAHPYTGLPDYAFWKQSVAETGCADVDPVVDPPFKLGPKDKVATAGSCFAQHISKRLRENGFRFLIAEAAEGGGKDLAERGFYDFSARYGNIYTARQLLQLFDRAFGYFKPLDRVWARREGNYCDPFRPRIEPNGFESEHAVIEDMLRHLGAVRKMFRQLDVLVFTLGLTEGWMSKLDGAVYPLAPGVVGGEFDPEKHTFVNFGVADVVADLRIFIGKLMLVNPRARLILTVSPVPLVATYEDRHVLVSTAYSKSVLRVAAEEVAKGSDSVYYFPSYEIITGNHAAGRYFEPDRRSVTSEGVDHVMRVFLARLTDASPSDRVVGSGDTAADAAIEAEVEALGEVLCDEELLAG